MRPTARGHSLGMLCTGVLCLLALAGCPNASVFRGVELSSTEETHVIGLVGVVQSEGMPCGYAAFAACALYHGVDSATLGGEPLLKEYGGRPLSAMDLCAAFAAVGIRANALDGEITDLEENVRNGRPVLALQDSAALPARYPSPHARATSAGAITLYGERSMSRFEVLWLAIFWLVAAALLIASVSR